MVLLPELYAICAFALLGVSFFDDDGGGGNNIWMTSKNTTIPPVRMAMRVNLFMTGNHSTELSLLNLVHNIP